VSKVPVLENSERGSEGEPGAQHKMIREHEGEGTFQTKRTKGKLKEKKRGSDSKGLSCEKEVSGMEKKKGYFPPANILLKNLVTAREIHGMSLMSHGGNLVKSAKKKAAQAFLNDTG